MNEIDRTSFSSADTRMADRKYIFRGVQSAARGWVRHDFDVVKMEPIPLRASAQEVSGKKKKQLLEEKSSRRGDPFESYVRSGLPLG